MLQILLQNQLILANSSPLSEDNKPIWGTCPDTSLSVNDQDVNNISMYPNPVVDKLFIQGVSDAQKFLFIIF